MRNSKSLARKTLTESEILFRESETEKTGSDKYIRESENIKIPSDEGIRESETNGKVGTRMKRMRRSAVEHGFFHLSAIIRVIYIRFIRVPFFVRRVS